MEQYIVQWAITEYLDRLSLRNTHFHQVHTYLLFNNTNYSYNHSLAIQAAIDNRNEGFLELCMKMHTISSAYIKGLNGEKLNG